MSEERLQELVGRHAECKTQRALALVEFEIMLMAPKEIPRANYNEMFGWQAKLLNETVYSLRMRRDLHLAGDAVEPLWVRVDSGLSLGTASRILKEARRNRDVVGYAKAVDDALAKFGYKSEREVEVEEVSLPPPESITSSRALFNVLRNTLMHYLQQQLNSIPEQDRELLVNEFERDISGVIHLHGAKWRRMALTQREQRMVTRAQFHRALLTLHMDPPKHGTELTQLLKQANKQKRTLARMYHPDLHGGSNETKPQYEAVIEAFLVVQQYVKENENRPVLHVVGGKED